MVALSSELQPPQLCASGAGSMFREDFQLGNQKPCHRIFTQSGKNTAELFGLQDKYVLHFTQTGDTKDPVLSHRQLKKYIPLHFQCMHKEPKQH